MTREEAKYLLNNLRSVAEGKEEEAIDMAIEALSAEEPVTLYATPKATYIRPLTEEIAIEFLQDSGCLVRCKDCRWWNSETNGCKRNPSVEAWYETDFCKYGERQCNYFGETIYERR